MYTEEFYLNLFLTIKKYNYISLLDLSKKLNINQTDLEYIVNMIIKNPCSWHEYGKIKYFKDNFDEINVTINNLDSKKNLIPKINLDKLNII